MDIAERNRIILNPENQNLVHMVASTFYYTGGLTYGDIIQEGTLGLIRGVEKYDKKKEKLGNFNSYVTWWIKHYIREAILNNKRIVRIPHSTRVLTEQYNKGRTKCTEIEKKRIIDANILIDRFKDNSPVEEPTYIHTTNVEKKDLINHVKGLMKVCLTQKEQDILDKYFYKGITPTNIAKEYEYTRQNIHCIIKRSLKKIYKLCPANYE